MQALGHLEDMADAAGDPVNDSLETRGGVEGGNFEADKKAEVPHHVEYVTQVSIHLRVVGKDPYQFTITLITAA